MRRRGCRGFFFELRLHSVIQREAKIPLASTPNPWLRSKRLPRWLVKNVHKQTDLETFGHWTLALKPTTAMSESEQLVPLHTAVATVWPLLSCDNISRCASDSREMTPP